MIIDISGDLIEVDSSILERLIIKREDKIGDTYFIEAGKYHFPCHQNFWEPFRREKRINLIIPLDSNS